ncbi:hypothetical protein BU26DRAFT_599145 [Trematosphaeria pertusa]|uniref:Uncharacterized protein n=1 Tax=Trematosphaeria pertusa TaxID=390896 RepID=A0A6A6J1M5_9PLEO|nr:uncharacterized protein BU26DRAFT_599145 [Trematosphaeria pertusa]KAF2256458.1 hypothetical protein BU26DRAFT_599145 [Trematosphaeria pertusa]
MGADGGQVTCFQTAFTSQSTCHPDDVQCVCTDEPLNAAMEACVLSACTVKEGLNAVNATLTSSRHCMNFARALARQLGLDDIFCIAAETACLPVTIKQSVTPGLGFGKDTWTVPADNIYMIQKLVYASEVSYFSCSGFTKLCFLFFFLRVFPGEHIQKAIYAVIAISVAYTVGFGTTMIFACRPISAVWTWFNIAIDLAIVAIPIPNLLRLKLGLRRKLFLVAIFSVGAITIVVSCIRLGALATYATSTNPLYDNLMAGVYSVLELNIGLMCVYMPALRRFLAQLTPRCFATTRDDCLFCTTIIMTVDTQAEFVVKQDDAVELVELQKFGKSVAGSMEGSNSRSVDTENSVDAESGCQQV